MKKDKVKKNKNLYLLLGYLIIFIIILGFAYILLNRDNTKYIYNDFVDYKLASDEKYVQEEIDILFPEKGDFNFFGFVDNPTVNNVVFSNIEYWSSMYLVEYYRADGGKIGSEKKGENCPLDSCETINVRDVTSYAKKLFNIDEFKMPSSYAVRNGDKYIINHNIKKFPKAKSRKINSIKRHDVSMEILYDITYDYEGGTKKKYIVRFTKIKGRYYVSLITRK